MQLPYQWDSFLFLLLSLAKPRLSPDLNLRGTVVSALFILAQVLTAMPWIHSEEVTKC